MVLEELSAVDSSVKGLPSTSSTSWVAQGNEALLMHIMLS